MTVAVQRLWSFLTALQFKNKGAENAAGRQKGLSGNLWMCLSSSEFSGHTLFMFFDCIIVHTLIWKCLVQTVRSLTEMKPGSLHIWSHYRNKYHCYTQNTITKVTKFCDKEIFTPFNYSVKLCQANSIHDCEVFLPRFSSSWKNIKCLRGYVHKFNVSSDFSEALLVTLNHFGHVFNKTHVACGDEWSEIDCDVLVTRNMNFFKQSQWCYFLKKKKTLNTMYEY